MTYLIRGLDPAQFDHLRDADDETLRAHNARRVISGADRGFPCRVTLDDAPAGESLILLNHLSHAVDTPYRSVYAIYVRENARHPAEFVDQTPPVLAGRPLALRGFAVDGMLRDARLAMPGEADVAIRNLLADEGIAYIDAHNAAHGCFAARIERHGDAA